MWFLKSIAILIFALTMASCCSSKKQSQPAKDALTDRNTRDPKLNNGPPKVELQDSTQLQQ